MSTDKYFLKTDRLGFRKWDWDDFPLAQALWGDYNVTRYIDHRGPLLDGQVAERLWREISCEEKHGVQYYPIFLHATGEHIGCCGLKPYNLATEVYEIGFHIRTEHWGKGYANEASKGIIEYAFHKMKMAGIYASHSPENVTSGELLIQLGFKHVSDEIDLPTGAYHPSYLLMAEEYPEENK